MGKEDGCDHIIANALDPIKTLKFKHAKVRVVVWRVTSSELIQYLSRPSKLVTSSEFAVVTHAGARFYQYNAPTYKIIAIDKVGPNT